MEHHLKHIFANQIYNFFLFYFCFKDKKLILLKFIILTIWGLQFCCKTKIKTFDLLKNVF